MHREDQIIAAVVGLLESQAGLAAAVFPYRTLSLSAQDQELPAVCVNPGEDRPTGEFGVDNLAFLDSVAQISVTVYAQGDSQPEVSAELSRLRVVVHKALMAAPQTVGLDFVMEVRYGGASAPDLSNEGSPLAGRRELLYGIYYRMNLADPE